MARDPGSVWAPLPEAGEPDGMVKTQFIVHSTGDNGTAAATKRYFSGPTLNESTFIVGWGPDDPTLQIMDSTDIADANGSANIRGISVEVAGDGVGEYNAWQRSELIRLGRWARATHPGILPRIIPSEPEAGFGWHVMFGAPGPWAKGAKVCPGKARIAELKADIFPAIFADKSKPTPVSEEDDDMKPKMFRVKGKQAVYLAAPGRWKGIDPNFLGTLTVMGENYELVDLPTDNHLAWAQWYFETFLGGPAADAFPPGSDRLADLWRQGQEILDGIDEPNSAA